MNNLLKHAQSDPFFVWSILASHRQFDWEVQGFGMLRVYLTKEVRLHIWDKRLRVPNVSTIHTHPWDFTSLILRGSITNVLYRESTGDGEFSATHNRALILCGHNAAIKSEVEECGLQVISELSYGSGETYQEEASEIHESRPSDGAITLIERHPKADPDHARVYWPIGIGTEWVDAKPRPATAGEVEMVLSTLRMVINFP